MDCVAWRCAAVDDGPHPRGGVGQPTEGVAAVVRVLGDARHRERVHGLQHQRPHAAGEHRSVGVDPPGDAVGAEEAVVLGRLGGGPDRRVVAHHHLGQLVGEAASDRGDDEGGELTRRPEVEWSATVGARACVERTAAGNAAGGSARRCDEFLFLHRLICPNPGKNVASNRLTPHTRSLVTPDDPWSELTAHLERTTGLPPAVARRAGG